MAHYARSQKPFRFTALRDQVSRKAESQAKDADDSAIVDGPVPSFELASSDVRLSHVHLKA